MRETSVRNNKEAAMAKMNFEPAPAKRKWDDGEYILTKINYTEESAKEDQTYHKERGRKTRLFEEGGYWLLYTRIGG